jgi:flagellar basal body P-ring formation protein FlgA
MRALPVLVLLACGAAGAGPRASIELLPDVRVQGDSVCLGEVAHLQSTDLALMRKLVSLPIGRAPRGGEPASVQREALAQWLRREVALAPEEVDWRGAAVVRVARVTRQVGGEEIAAAASEALQSWLAAQGVAADLQARPMPRDLAAPASEVRLQVRPLEHMPLRERMVVWVDLWSEGTFLRAVPVAFAVVQKAMPLGSPAPLGVQPLTVADAPLLVARGEWATLRSSAGAVLLESRVEVLQDGRAGQRVRVRSQGATGLVFARVIGPAQLELAP